MRNEYNEKKDIGSQRGGVTHEYTEEMDIDPACPGGEYPTTDVEMDMIEGESPTPQCLSALSKDTIVESGKGTRNAVNKNGVVQASRKEKQAHGEGPTSGWSCSPGTVDVSKACSANIGHVCTTNTTRPVHGLTAKQSYSLKMAATEQDFARLPEEMNTQSHSVHELGLLKRADPLMRTMDKGSRSKLIESPLAAWGQQVKLEPGQTLLMQCLHSFPDLWLHLGLFRSHYHHAFLVNPGGRSDITGPKFWQEEVPAVWQFIMGMPFQEEFLAYASTKGHSLSPITTMFVCERSSPHLYQLARPMLVRNQLRIDVLPAQPRPMCFTIRVPPRAPHLCHKVLPKPRSMPGWSLYCGSDPTNYLGTLGMKHPPEMVVFQCVPKRVNLSFISA